jgi:hypothetical protein
VKVRVERVRRGRRLPEVEYVEARAPRQWQKAKQEQNGGFRDEGFSMEPSQPPSGLRLPWRINHGSR